MLVLIIALLLCSSVLFAQTEWAMVASTREGTAPVGMAIAADSAPSSPSSTATEFTAAIALSASAVSTVLTTMEVHAEDSIDLDALAPTAVISQKELQSAAGTFGDFSRYLQVLPGVVWNSDLSNEVLVRGGHPTENLFVVDGIEVPNINHFALSGSNGGFTSMIDTAVIGTVDLHAGTYDASHSSRLSSLIEIHTRGHSMKSHEGEVSVGIAGAGGYYSRPLVNNGSLLLSAHRSVMNLVTNDIGINGVPTYTNGMMRVELNPTSRDHLSLLALGGEDSIEVTPCPSDARVTSINQMQYSGWRSTGGLTWDHTHSDQTGSKLIVSYSTMNEKIDQQQQNGYLNKNGIKTCNPISLTPVYNQDSNDGQGTLDYQLRTVSHGWIVSAGSSERLIHLNDLVSQPVGQLSPFNTSTIYSDSVNFRRNFTTAETAAFIEFDRSIGARWRAMIGLRGENFALDGRFALDPRASIAYRINEHQSAHLTANIASQLPPLINILSYVQNHSLRPITVTQESAGLRVWEGNWGTIDLDAYEKHYRNELVSTEYPQLMLANMIDTIGQQFVWLPLKSAGTQTSRGIELALRAHLGSHMQLLTSATYARTSTRSLDGIRRPGNFDIPLVLNATASIRLPWRLELNVRESLSSGRLYTPFDLVASNAQSRGIYDLTKVNGARGPLYNRLDLQVEHNFRLGMGVMNLQIGAENILDRSNLLGYTWLNNCKLGSYCAYGVEPMIRVTQMGLYPVASARYHF